MKTRRQCRILELIAQYDIETQEELLKKLDESGLTVTQAT
ncbi:MAG: arginine repressor, partial [Clostridia bacterium]|nr:arginine repressor [Clostridia bacterium]